MVEQKRQKRPYTKPTIKQVELRPAEAVLGFCKSTTTAGPGGARCNSPVSCSSLGS